MRRQLRSALPLLLSLPLGGLAAPARGGADLAVAIVDAPDPVAAGGALLYEVTVANHGPDDASGVQLVDVLAENVTFTSVTVLADAIFSDGFESGSTSAWGAAVASGCSVAGRIVTCGLGSLDSGSSVVVEIKVTVSASAAGQLSNSATVGAATTDGTPGNDTATATTTVATATADLALAVSDAPDPVAIGQILSYTLTVTNFGPNTATGIEVMDGLPPELTYLGSSGGCFLADGLVTCSLPDLESGGSAAVTLTTRVGAKAAFAITNPAAVSAATTDGNPGNNEDTEVTTVP